MVCADNAELPRAHCNTYTHAPRCQQHSHSSEYMYELEHFRINTCAVLEHWSSTVVGKCIIGMVACQRARSLRWHVACQRARSLRWHVACQRRGACVGMWPARGRGACVGMWPARGRGACVDMWARYGAQAHGHHTGTTWTRVAVWHAPNGGVLATVAVPP